MNSTDTETMTALQSLLEERQRYEGWLRTLDERKASTSARVFDRVHADYSERLDKVRSRLAEHTEQLRATVAVMNSKLEELRTRETDRIDTRSEAELRAAVGEYSEEEWTQLREEADLEIEILAQEREELETELTELERIIASSEGSAANAAATALGEATSSSVSQTSAAGPSPVEGTTGVNGAMESGDHTPSLDDFVDWPDRKEPPAATAQGDGIPRAPEVADKVPTVSPKSNGGSATATVSAAASTKTPPRGVPSAQHVPTAEPPRRDSEKSLKCPECSALNYATEWYCERCGGELATF